MKVLIFFYLTVFGAISFAKVKVVTTTADIASLVREVGNDLVEVHAIAKGSQDPHFIEAKPSYMVRLRDADLLLSNGLSLEVGWLPSLIRGARNPKITPGSPGHLELGSLIDPIDLPQGKLTRALGDVHPEGNPHFMLDPIIMGQLAIQIAKKLSEIDSANKDKFEKNGKKFQASLVKKLSEWQERIAKSGVKKVITYHPSMNYFLKRFNLTAVSHLEAKPGIPPSAQHILHVIDVMKKENVKIILVDNFFDTKIAERIKKEVAGSQIKSVGISVDSEPYLKTLPDVTEHLVRAIEAP